DPFYKGVLDAKLPGLIRRVETVEVKMPDCGGPDLVDLHKGEGGTGNLFLAAARVDKSAGKGGFAGPEIAFERDDVAPCSNRRDARGECGGGSFIGQIDDGHRSVIVYPCRRLAAMSARSRSSAALVCDASVYNVRAFARITGRSADDEPAQASP